MSLNISQQNNTDPIVLYPTLPDIPSESPEEFNTWWRDSYRPWYDDLKRRFQRDREDLISRIAASGGSESLTEEVAKNTSDITALLADITAIQNSIDSVNTRLLNVYSKTETDNLFSGKSAGKFLVDYSNLVNVPPPPPPAVTFNTYPFKYVKTGFDSFSSVETKKITYGILVYDPSSVFASDTFTVPVTGFYGISSNVYCEVVSGSVTSTFLSVYHTRAGSVSGSINRQLIHGANGFQRYYPMADFHYLIAGDTVQVTAEVNGSGAGTVGFYGNPECHFSGFRIA